MAKLVRQVHELNISLPDLYIWHIFIREDCLGDECKLSVIDLHRMAHGVTSSGKMAKELGKLYWSMLSEYFDDNLKDLFLAEYMGECLQDVKRPAYPKGLQVCEDNRKATKLSTLL